MAPLLEFGSTFLLVDFLCAAAVLGVGFAAGVGCYGAAARMKHRQDDEDRLKIVAARVELATNRLTDLAQAIASDVGDHSRKIATISATIREIDPESGGGEAAIDTALEQILLANGELQKRLDLAEQQFQVQAAELRDQQSEARIDSLTKLANRRAFDDEIRRRLSEWRRRQIPFSLALLDIDRFKKFNDTHGHQIGDEVLRTVARVLVAEAREGLALPLRR